MKHKFYIFFIAIFLQFYSCNTDNNEGRAGNDDDIIEVNPEDKLPQFYINTNGASIVDEPKIPAELSLIEAGNEVYSGRIGIEIRGKSSQLFPKKQFGFETWDESNEDMDASLLGYPEEEDWILYAPYSDKSLIRNLLIYELSNEIGRYASRTTLAEVFINESYNGLYVFMEKLKRDDNRININKLKEDENSGEDLTGGYILKLDKSDGPSDSFYDSNNSFTSNFAPPSSTAAQEIHFLFDDPDMDDITVEQKAYISDYVDRFETALASDNFSDSEDGYSQFIDIESFIDFFLLNELANNVDGYRLSTWITKDKNDKLRMGPIWDFNLAFGNANYCGGGNTDVWAYKFNERCPDDFWQIPFWWNRLMEDPNFVSQLKNRWQALRANQFSNANITAKIDSYVETMTQAGSIESNYDKWPVLGVYVWPNNFVGQTHEEEINFLKNWIDQRLSWLDSNIGSL